MDVAAAALAKYDRKCKECGEEDFVEDHAQGDLICRHCGVVAESHAIDERSEWRTFADKDKESTDPNRVGGPTNNLLSDGGLSTTIAVQKGGDAGGLGNILKRTHARSNTTDRSLITAFREIGDMCGRLGLVSAIKDRANELYKKVSDSKIVKGRGANAVYAAVIYIACRQEGIPRTFKEICAVITDVSKRDIGRCYKFIVKELEQDMGTIHASDFLRRFGSRVGLNAREMAIAEQVAIAACPKDGKRPGGKQKPWDGKSPLSVAAAIIYMLTCLPKVSTKPTLSEIASVTGVADVTIRSTYKELHADAAEVIPSSFVTKADLDSLPD